MNQRRVALAPLRLARRPRDEVTEPQLAAADLRGGDVHVTGGGLEAAQAQEPVSTVGDVEHPADLLGRGVAAPLDLLFGLRVLGLLRAGSSASAEPRPPRPLRPRRLPLRAPRSPRSGDRAAASGTRARRAPPRPRAAGRGACSRDRPRACESRSIFSDGIRSARLGHRSDQGPRPRHRRQNRRGRDRDPRWPRPPAPLHRMEDEGFYVLSGRIEIQLGETRILGATSSSPRAAARSARAATARTRAATPSPCGSVGTRIGERVVEHLP